MFHLRKLLLNDLKEILKQNPNRDLLDLTEVSLEDMDLSGWNLRNIDFSWSTFKNIKFDSADMSGSSVNSALFENCSLHNTILKNADLYAANLRYCDLSNANIEGANMNYANLEYANLDKIIYNDDTKFFKLRCPEKGAFIAWKKCVDFRMVQLLIPEDAKRTSATLHTCRCNKAKVLSIKSIDYKESYDWARSFVDENFIYRVGEMMEVKDFNEDRWMDSTTGIHFFMTREEAIEY
ncbi:pentapeptide repeat-containing protein [Asaccharospora irregularis]|uniref:pentapeptide repeat-containing protein n=1 Tax=Asaccharospora irregularis TaxID=29359 RepID=UPI003CD0AF49